MLELQWHWSVAEQLLARKGQKFTKAEDTGDVHGRATINQSNPTGSHEKCFLDSGAIKNMSFQRRYFTNFKDIQPETLHWTSPH
jgi:hypothetical protein